VKNNPQYNMSFLGTSASGFCKKSIKNILSFNKTLTNKFILKLQKLIFFKKKEISKITGARLKLSTVKDFCTL